jgi:hypothetical protein
MTAATVLVIAITIARELRQRRDPRRPSSPPSPRGAARAANRPRRAQAARSPSARRGPGRDDDDLAATALRPAGPRRPRD